MSHIEKETELLSNCRLVTVGADKMMYNEDEVMVEKWSVGPSDVLSFVGF